MYFDPLMAADKVLEGTKEMDGGQITAMTIVGLLVVFSALLILVVFLYGSGSIFKKIGGKPQKKLDTKKAAPPPKPAAPAAVKPAQKPPAPKAAPAPAAAEDDTEVIAVIMAAIAAMGAAEGKTYQLKSVKPADTANPRRTWAQAGLLSQTRPF